MEYIILGALFLFGLYIFFFMHKEFRKEVRELTRQISGGLRDQNQLINERLEGANKVVGDVHHRLGRLEQASQQIFDLGKEIRDLENILKAPKLRGVWSELFLDELIAQVVPKENYTLQYSFHSGHKVDAVIHLANGLVCIDAKFPLENFKRILESENEEERRKLKMAFANNVKKHIEDIAEKYILPNEGTFDFALMYIPAEHVYYEIMSGRDEVIGTKGLSEFARGRKVIPVSPSTFFSYLQTILLGLKGMRIEQSAREVLEHLSRLKNDFTKFSEDFRILGGHIKNTELSYGKLDKFIQRFNERLSAPPELSTKEVPHEELV